MPCDTQLKSNQTLEQRGRAIDQALARLEGFLKSGQVKVTIGPTGAVSFTGWKPEDRDDVTDVCSYRTLTMRNSWELRQAVARAEAQQGRKVNPAAIAAGHHSHDGGKTFGPGHK